MTGNNIGLLALRVIALVLRAILCSTLLAARVPSLGFIAFEVWAKVIVLLYFVMLACDMIELLVARLI